MEKKHWYYIIVCSLIIFISGILYFNYYQDYVAPRSYTIGSFKPKDYTTLDIKQQLTSDTVLFSQDLDNVSFKVDNSTGVATYELSSSPISFNGEYNDYVVYVHHYLFSHFDVTSGAISGTHDIQYYDVDKSVLATSRLNISFASYTKNLLLKITMPGDDIGLLMRYFEVNDFIVTLALNPFNNTKPLSYEVKFVNNNEVVSTQWVEFGKTATVPTLEGNYGWICDNQLVDISTTAITGNITFTAYDLDLMNGTFIDYYGQHMVEVVNNELVSWVEYNESFEFVKAEDGIYYEVDSFVSYERSLKYDFNKNCWIYTFYDYNGDYHGVDYPVKWSEELVRFEDEPSIEEPEEQSYTITFSYAVGSVTATEGWTVSGNTATKTVIAGEEIGTLPGYSVSNATVDYWYYLDSNNQQVKVTTTSIMPASNITLLVKTTSNSASM